MFFHEKVSKNIMKNDNGMNIRGELRHVIDHPGTWSSAAKRNAPGQWQNQWGNSRLFYRINSAANETVNNP